ncbi:hypothetical protein [Streptomyces acidiscabies]|uniref:Secreted protein n=1 Tax=Streptomyces acidiscabies TaxID=42234 RepID=A0AAP6BG94_9ACTN|nr:hypothetical protein [Streptomyces acidiscabies]MBP5937815.1 hypothetical protein [Streptomyces sp. LBUM 1476]MBZ3914070.1 hypothetical protein [Streptomyces acidiscabies]MDX2964196.1 hypothetical protein [Streptomyces acidiscabies]MDX3016834.1 hypothetical protein [Streptomyces acidiscabies]MDX3794136.1 hypothetical protein [Streptomyces acidiscabies]
MPRGRHRHSPPLHRLLPPSAIAGVSLVCAFGPWLFSDTAVLRVIAAFAAAVAVVGAAVLRRWDAQAGKTVADLSRARVSDEWRYEERVAELETDLEESRELRGKLEQRLRAKRAELAGLRNEHAALLRRYANAETERASALEGRRRLELEALTPVEGEGAEAEVAESAVAVAVEPAVPGLFSPEGSKLFLRAAEALGRFERPGAAEGGSAEGAAGAVEAGVAKGAVKGGAGDVLSKGGSPKAGSPVKGDGPSGGGSPQGDGPEGGEPVAEDEGEGKTEAADAQEHAVAGSTGREERYEALRDGVSEANGIPARDDASQESTSAALDVRTRDVPARGTDAAAEPARGTVEVPQQPAHALEPAHATGIPQQTSTSGEIVRRPAGHFAVPTAVAVVPGEPVRRPAIEGGFDFFGTKQDDGPAALEAVQNEDLADVVGQEALALHKAESEAEFKPADETSRAVGQVVDLTSHDETEQLDLQGLRSAAY